MRLVRPKSCAFINFCDTGAARALQAKFGGSEDAGLEIGGKRLTVNFARARPCKDEQLKQVAEGARRKLKVFLPEHISSEQLIGMLGHKAEQLVDSASVPMTEAEASRTRAEMAGEEDGESPPPTPTHAVRLDFSSLSTAIAVKGSLEALGGSSAVSGVDFVIEPVMAPEEIQALLQATSETGGELAEIVSEEVAEGVQEPPAEALE